MARQLCHINGEGAHHVLSHQCAWAENLKLILDKQLEILSMQIQRGKAWEIWPHVVPTDSRHMGGGAQQRISMSFLVLSVQTLDVGSLVPRPPRAAFVTCSKRQKLPMEAWERG